MTYPLPIQSVNHIARVTHDLETSLAFYRDVLGFRHIRRPNFAFPGAWLFSHPPRFKVMEAISDSPLKRERGHPCYCSIDYARKPSRKDLTGGFYLMGAST